MELVHLPEYISSAESKGTLNITIKDNEDNGVAGVKIKLTSKKDNTEYESSISGTLGGCKIENLPYGQYTVTLSTIPTNYTQQNIDDITIDESNNTLNVILTKDN